MHAVSRPQPYSNFASAPQTYSSSSSPTQEHMHWLSHLLRLQAGRIPQPSFVFQGLNIVESPVVVGLAPNSGLADVSSGFAPGAAVGREALEDLCVFRASPNRTQGQAEGRPCYSRRSGLR